MPRAFLLAIDLSACRAYSRDVLWAGHEERGDALVAAARSLANI